MINQVGRWLGAFAVVLVLGIDDIEQVEGDLNKPKPVGIDPVQWALYNESQQRNLAGLDGTAATEPGVIVARRCECATCETCQRRHAEARAVVNDALAAALRGEDEP